MSFFNNVKVALFSVKAENLYYDETNITDEEEMIDDSDLDKDFQPEEKE